MEMLMADTNSEAVTIIPLATVLADLAATIRNEIANIERSFIDFADATIRLAFAFKDAREQFPSNAAFGRWIADNDLDGISPQDRAALINMAENAELARDVLLKTNRRSLRLVWENEIAPRLCTATKTPEADAPEAEEDEAPETDADEADAPETGKAEAKETESETEDVEEPEPALNVRTSTWMTCYECANGERIVIAVEATDSEQAVKLWEDWERKSKVPDSPRVWAALVPSLTGKPRVRDVSIIEQKPHRKKGRKAKSKAFQIAPAPESAQ
jgi:hypothetical protein